MTILYDENICVRCLACVSESECGGGNVTLNPVVASNVAITTTNLRA